MKTQKQVITATQEGVSCQFGAELESPMKDGMYLPDVQYLEMRKVSNFGGARVRIMKGLWVGGGRAKTHDELTKVDSGYLTISSKNKNVIFAGQSSTISIPFAKIVRIQPYSDGIGIYKEGRQKEYRFIWGKSINMKLTNVKGDNGKIKPLSGIIISQYINTLSLL